MVQASVISMVGTVTQDISQHLNKTIRPYLDTTYMVKCSDEILADLSSLRVHKTEKIVSLDVEPLFTSVPVMKNDRLNTVKVLLPPKPATSFH